MTDQLHDLTGGSSQEDFPEPGKATEEARGLSLLRRAEQERNKRSTNLFLEIPSWDGALICEYEVIPKEELKVMGERAARKIRSGERDASVFDVDVIVRASVALYALDDDQGQELPGIGVKATIIEDEYGPVGYDRIAIVLGKEHLIKSNADAVKYLMGIRTDEGDGWRENVTAVSQHARTISRWMRDPSRGGKDVLEELLGES